MATTPDTADYILQVLHDPLTFSVRRMFGEYCLYANRKPVAFICDNTLFVKILPASAALEPLCDKGPAYPGSKDYFVTEESVLNMPELPDILRAIGESIPDK
jgi:TfoX/Sxy family transcriptional regulator of competence genes